MNRDFYEMNDADENEKNEIMQSEEFNAPQLPINYLDYMPYGNDPHAYDASYNQMRFLQPLVTTKK